MNDEKQALVPRLRFPEFREAGEWEEKPLGKLGQIITGKTPSTKNSELWGSGIPFITPTDMSEDIKYQKTTARKVLKTKDIKVLPKGSIVYTCIASIGKMALTVCESTTNQQINSVVVHPDTNNEFVFYALSNLTPWIKTIPASSTLAIINKTEFSGVPIKLPNTKNEQQKIADCLSSLDALIAAQADKLDALKTHKKGLMQQLFPREGETVPRLRFPEFREAGEWVVKTVSEFAQITTGNKDTQNKVDDGAYPFFVRSQTIERINSYSFDGEAVLTSGDGVGVGKIYHYIAGKFDFHQRVYCIFDFSENVSGKYFYLYFSAHFYSRVMQLSAKNSVDSVRMAMIADMSILVPDLEEQTKIVDCLFSIDDLIAAQADKLDALKTHKKGLMQQLFPSPEA